MNKLSTIFTLVCLELFLSPSLSAAEGVAGDPLLDSMPDRLKARLVQRELRHYSEQQALDDAIAESALISFAIEDDDLLEDDELIAGLVRADSYEDKKFDDDLKWAIRLSLPQEKSTGKVVSSGGSLPVSTTSAEVQPSLLSRPPSLCSSALPSLEGQLPALSSLSLQPPRLLANQSEDSSEIQKRALKQARIDELKLQMEKLEEEKCNLRRKQEVLEQPMTVCGKQYDDLNCKTQELIYGTEYAEQMRKLYNNEPFSFDGISFTPRSLSAEEKERLDKYEKLKAENLKLQELFKKRYKELDSEISKIDEERKKPGYEYYTLRFGQDFAETMFPSASAASAAVTHTDNGSSSTDDGSSSLSPSGNDDDDASWLALKIPTPKKASTPTSTSNNGSSK